MAPVTLPPSFFNSFWSADYRKGLEVLFRELDQVHLYTFRRENTDCKRAALRWTTLPHSST